MRAVTDYGPGRWLQECLDGAQDMLAWTLQYSPTTEHIDEVMAEIQFWSAALQLLASGAGPPADRTAPPTITLDSVRTAADLTLGRYRESFDNNDPESFRANLPPGMAEWQRLRDFVDEY